MVMGSKISNPVKNFGTIESRTWDTVYFENLDGFIYFKSNNGGNPVVYSDNGNPPGTKVFQMHIYGGNDPVSGCIPIKKGNYWNMPGVAMEFIYWIPLK